jgi:hypothetical protein
VLNESLDRSEELAAGFLGSPELLESLIVLAGQGNTAAGIAVVRTSLENTLTEYCRRCEHAGLRDRNHRSKLASFTDWLI